MALFKSVLEGESEREREREREREMSLNVYVIVLSVLKSFILELVIE